MDHIIEEIKEELDIFLDTFFEERGIMQVSLDNWPLDTRACPSYVRANKDCLVVPLKDTGRLGYYGGFEYVDKEYVAIVGDYTIYSGQDKRVREVLDELMNDEEEVVYTTADGEEISSE